MEIAVQQERREQFEQVEELIRQAFLGEAMSDQTEHQLVKRLRESEAFVPELSLVAKRKDGMVIGHILLSKAEIIGDARITNTLALAPVSVLPEHQGKGVGSRLIRKALERARDLGFTSVIVLGHPGYYPKFGFEPADRWGIRPPFDVPAEAFMALELQEGALEEAAGVVRYADAFSA